MAGPKGAPKEAILGFVRLAGARQSLGSRSGQTRARRALPAAVAAWAILAGVGQLGADPQPESASAPSSFETAQPESDGSPGHLAPASPLPWLDEVRAQRRAREERRQAARETFEARRRANDPIGAAHREAWQADIERRRETRQREMDEDREHFRELGASMSRIPEPGEPLPGWPEPSKPPPPPFGGPALPEQRSTEGWLVFPGYPSGAAPSPATPRYLQDWDNHWYYRGY